MTTEKHRTRRLRLRNSREECWTLLGWQRNRIWYARKTRRWAGESASVEFDGLWVLAREEQRHDVAGFFHTHPAGPAGPSTRDVRTMRAWVSAFGKPLLCVIASPGGLKAYRFDSDRSSGTPLAAVEVFPRGIIVGVEPDGR